MSMGQWDSPYKGGLSHVPYFEARDAGQSDMGQPSHAFCPMLKNVTGPFSTPIDGSDLRELAIYWVVFGYDNEHTNV